MKFLKQKAKKHYSSHSVLRRKLSVRSITSKSVRNRENLLFGRTKSLFEKNDGRDVHMLRKAGLIKFLKTEAGGNNSTKNALLTCKRLASYIIWVRRNKQKGVGDKTSYDKEEVTCNVLNLFQKQPQYIGEYMDHLTFQNATPSTKLSIINHFRKCALWAMISAPIALTTELHCFEKICKNICRSCKRQNSLRIQNRGNLDYLKEKKRWPKGGYAELSNHVLNSCKFIDELAVKVRNGVHITKTEYCRLLRVLIALLYLTSHQGRPNAIKKLT